MELSDDLQHELDGLLGAFVDGCAAVLARGGIDGRMVLAVQLEVVGEAAAAPTEERH